MKRWSFLLGLLALPALAADYPTDAVLLQALDKTTGRTSFLPVKVGQPYEYGDLSVLVSKCMKRPQDETPENTVFITVTEKGEEIFKGWMFSSNPALSAMDHPVYDIWVVECKDPTVHAYKAIMKPADEMAVEEVSIEALED